MDFLLLVTLPLKRWLSLFVFSDGFTLFSVLFLFYVSIAIHFFVRNFANAFVFRKFNFHWKGLSTEDCKMLRESCNGTWKDYKLLGTLLGILNDIKIRKRLVVNARTKLQYFFKSTKITVNVITKWYQCYITCIILYNSEM